MLKNLVILFAFSTFVTIVWIATSLFHASTTSKISVSNQKKIQPINSSFDLETLTQLESREEIKVNLADPVSIFSETEEISDDIENDTSATPASTESAVINTQITPTL